MNLTSLPLQGRTCVITGATSGIGRATAVALSAAGANLILVGRRESIGIQLAAQLRHRPGPGWAEFFRADISDQQQVRELASRISARESHIDILINNAGARFNTFRRAPDGLELTFATNYLGHFLLTCLILKSLLQAPSARVITLGSGAHSGATVDGTWWLDSGTYDRKLAYAKSKLANIVFSYELARRLRPTRVTSNAVDPGGVATSLGRNNGLLSWCRHLAFYALKGKLLFPRRGAETVIHLALDPALDRVSGLYYYKKQAIHSSAASQNVEGAAKLWSRSIALTKLGPQMGSAWEWINPEA